MAPKSSTPSANTRRSPKMSPKESRSRTNEPSVVNKYALLYPLLTGEATT